ncbi:MAG: methyltransferase domain-containing protein [Caldisericales bacterium]|nr:methyltransferase domain-containing protein [Caldisericales bacterium]
MDDREVGKYWDENARAWTDLSRLGYDICRDQFNTPGFVAMLPEVKGLEGLDIGCGEGSNTRIFASLGASMIALDISPTFIGAAKAMEQEKPLGIKYVLGSALDLPFEDSSFDFCVATMSFMDIPGPEKALVEAFRVLKPGGFLQFSITHPCFDTPVRFWVFDEDGNKKALAVGGYFDELGGDILEWIFAVTPQELKDKYPKFKTPCFRKTLGSWINMIVDTGFIVERLGEPRPTEEVCEKYPSLADARLVSLFLHIRARKPG